MIVEHLALLKPWMTDYQVTQFQMIDMNLRLKAKIAFIDGSVLFIKEIMIDGQQRKYAYHWQDPQCRLICRWDNAPDWPEVNTFPHHKHLPGGIEASPEIEAAAIFTAIKTRFETETPGEPHA